jgi:hypothetical protein
MPKPHFGDVAEPDEQGLQVVGSCEEVAVAVACFYEAVACLAEGVGGAQGHSCGLFCFREVHDFGQWVVRVHTDCSYGGILPRAGGIGEDVGSGGAERVAGGEASLVVVGVPEGCAWLRLGQVVALSGLVLEVGDDLSERWVLEA